MEFLAKTLGVLASISLVPFIILNFLAGIVGGIWLIVMGQWMLAVLALITVFIMPMVFGIILLPTMPLAMLMFYLKEKNKLFWMSVVAWINLTIVQVVMIIWAYIVFVAAILLSGDTNVIPYLLVGYAVATGPIASMAKNEGPDATASHMGAWLVQVSYVILSIFYFLDIVPFALPILLLLAFLIASYLLKVANLYAKAEKEYDTRMGDI